MVNADKIACAYEKMISGDWFQDIVNHPVGETGKFLFSYNAGKAIEALDACNEFCSFVEKFGLKTTIPPEAEVNVSSIEIGGKFYNMHASRRIFFLIENWPAN